MGKGFLAAPAVQISQETPPTLIFQGYNGFFPSENSDRGVKLAIYAYKLPELKSEPSYPAHLSYEFRAYHGNSGH
jgi:hypothetical protein